MEENVSNTNGTLVWKILDNDDAVLGELIVAWGAATGEYRLGGDWSRDLHAWRVATFLPGEYVMQKVETDKTVDGATPYERSAQANEIWNDHVLDNGVQPGTTAAEYRGTLTPIPGMVYDEQQA